MIAEWKVTGGSSLLSDPRSEKKNQKMQLSSSLQNSIPFQ